MPAKETAKTSKEPTPTEEAMSPAIAMAAFFLLDHCAGPMWNDMNSTASLPAAQAAWRGCS